jgi:hypothetical protein
LAKEAGTNNTTATYWVRVLEQIGYITPNGTHAPDKGKRGKPAKCWLVTLPDLPPLLQEVWVMPEKPPQQQAPVVGISERPQSKTKRVGAPATLTAQIGNLAQALAPDNAPTVQPEPAPAYSQQTLAVLANAEACIRQQLATQVQAQGLDPEQADRRTTLVVEQARGSWHARYGKRLPPVKQVENALRQGTCTDTEAVRYLASGQCNKADLLQFVGVRPST